MRATQRKPEIVMRNGRPKAVILDIRQYEDMLERLEDAEDLRWLREYRKKPHHPRDFEEFLAEPRRA